MQPQQRNKTRRASGNDYGLNTELETFLNVNASEAYKRPWHRLERGLRLNRLRKFIEGETARLNLQPPDVEQLTNILHRALDKKLLNSKACVIYDPEKEEIQEIKGLVYHRNAEGRLVSSIVEKKASTLRRKATKENLNSNPAKVDEQPQPQA